MEEKIYSSNEDIFEIISEVLRKNGLQETLDDAAEKDDAENSLIITVSKLTEEFAKEKISEKDFVSLLEKQLKISSQTAEIIAKDIKGRILPGLEKIKIENREGESATVNPIRLIKKEQNLADNAKSQTQPDIKNAQETEKLIKKKPKIVKNVINETKNNEPSKTSKKPDGYRESVE